MRCRSGLLRLEWELGVAAGGRSALSVAFLVFVHELVLSLLLGMQMRETDVVDPELEVLPVLHDLHGVVHHMECELEGALELLLVSD